MSNVISPNFIVSSEPKCLIFVSFESKHNPKCNLWIKSWKYILIFVSKTMAQDTLLQNLKTKNILWFMLLELNTPKNRVKMRMKYEIKRKCCYSIRKIMLKNVLAWLLGKRGLNKAAVAGNGALLAVRRRLCFQSGFKACDVSNRSHFNKSSFCF